MITTLLVPEIHCGHCKASIEGAVKPLDGVSDVTVDIEATSVTVEHDQSVSRADLVSTIEDQGYEVPQEA